MMYFVALTVVVSQDRKWLKVLKIYHSFFDTALALRPLNMHFATKSYSQLSCENFFTNKHNNPTCD